MKKDPTPPSPADLTAAIRERINKMELKRTQLRAEIDNPPDKANAYYFTDRLDEIRFLTLTIDAVRDLI